jgi:hypothetical protein
MLRQACYRGLVAAALLQQLPDKLYGTEPCKTHILSIRPLLRASGRKS